MNSISSEHLPVLLRESIAALRVEPGEIVLDCTFGRGGHTRAFLEAVGTTGMVIGLDVDPSAAKEAKELDHERFRFVALNFSNLDVAVKMLGITQVDKVFFDLGVSSPQFDQGDRGFSFRHDAPLDMRMDPSQSVTAASIVNTSSVEELSRIMWEYGEERWAKRIANFIVEQRKIEPVNTTMALVDIIKGAIPKKVREEEGQHPARRTFQALRIAVNDELGALQTGLEKAVKHLKPGGRIGCISFHSLEDRIIKQFYVARSRPCTCPPGLPQCVCHQIPDLVVINRKPIIPSEQEVLDNPRSRSAKLRVAERLAVF